MGEDIDLHYSQTILLVVELKKHTNFNRIARITMFINSSPQ